MCGARWLLSQWNSVVLSALRVNLFLAIREFVQKT
jgi:hypothetical protein